MIVLSAADLTKEYGGEPIIKDVSFHINKGDKVGVVGANGAGKTTLFKVLAGEERATAGEYFISNETEIGYLRQNPSVNSHRTIRQEIEAIFQPLYEMEAQLEEIASAIPTSAGEEQKRLIEKQDRLRELYERRGGYTFRSEMKGIMQSMAFLEDSFDRKIDSLSGGEKTRLALGLLLLKRPDVLLLDEPTNHLDIGTLQWLEQYLKNYRGTLVVISHDRFFLDQLCNRIFEVHAGRLRTFEGNYTYYAARKKEIREEELRRYHSYQREVEKQEDLIRRYKQRGTEKLAKRAASREKMLERMEKVDAPESDGFRMKIEFKERYKSGNDVLFMQGVSKTFKSDEGVKKLFKDVDMDVKRGERICIVGANGIGKTTLLRLIKGELLPDSGRIRLGHNIELDYYDQEQKLLHEDMTVLDEVHDDFQRYTATDIRSILGRFLFRGDDVFTRVGDLSGGERARLSLLKIMMRGGNLLLLDEPTNHLDIESREIFEDALMDFPGTVIAISHDRYFLNKVPTKIMELSKTGFTTFLGKYNYYFEKKQQIRSGKKYIESLREAEIASAAGEEKGKDELAGDAAEALTDSAKQRKLQKKEEARKRKLEREKKQAEHRITELEKEIGELEKRMCESDVITDLKKLGELGKELESKKAGLDRAYEKWLQYE